MRIELILIAVIVVLSGIGFWYYKDSQSRIEILQHNTAMLESSVQINEQTIAEMRRSTQLLNQEIERVNTEFATIKRQNQILIDKFADSDIGLLAEAKPELIERIIDNASDKAFRCFELMSGAELTDQERNARNANEFNSECPWLYDDLVSPSGMR